MRWKPDLQRDDWPKVGLGAREYYLTMDRLVLGFLWSLIVIRRVVRAL
jgi:hypothetical protein